MSPNRSSRSFVIVASETLAVLAGVALVVSAKTIQPYMWAGVGLLVASFVMRWAATGRLAKRTALDVPLLLFVASALVGVWAAYDQPVAWVKFLHILGGVAFYYLLASRAAQDWFAVAVVVCLSLFGAALSVYFVTQFDFGAQPGKFALITRLGTLINSVTPRLPGQPPHANIVAGALAVILPLSVAALIGVRHSALRMLFSVSACCMITAVAMTTSRGAWLALGGVAVATVVGYGARRRIPEQWHGRLIVAALAMAMLALVVVVFSPGDLLTRALGGIPGGGSALGRGDLYRQAGGLIEDYVFTGSGLGMFGMVYSSYVRLIWVHYLAHAHNFFLQVWIEQGVFGFVALVWIVAAFYVWAWRLRKQLTWLGWGALAAGSVMLLHGLVDNPLYSFRILPLLFAPLGLLMSNDALPANGLPSVRRGRALAVVACLALVLLAVLSRHQLAALWYANLGSVAQAKLELKDYAFPDRLVDDVRRTGDLSAVERSLQQALLYDAGNRSARQRLALIALGRREHEQALAYIEPAYQSTPDDAVTRQLLCEAYLGLGRTDDAFLACTGVSGAAIRLEGVAIVRYERNKDTQRAAWARALAQRLIKR
jgi:O-antigen ligase